MAIATLIAVALQAAQPAQEPTGLLDLLAGEWICRAEMLAGEPVWRTESWRRDGEGRLTGVVGERRGGSQELRQEAELVISGHGRSTQLTYRPTGGAAVHYRLVRDAREEAVFESRNGSPRIISYRHSGFRRLEVMHGLAEGGSRRWSYDPPGMHTGVIGCDGRR